MSVYGKRCLAFVLAALLLVLASRPAQAGGGDPQEGEAAAAMVGQTPLAISAKSVILLEQSTGQVLYEANADEKIPPASITKIMTLLLSLEAIEAGKLKLTDMVTCSDHASTMGGSQIWLEPGEQMSVDDLIKATAVSSANDAAVLLGEAVAGSEEAFVDLMNRRAKELGMANTMFYTASGLDESGHTSTARDVALMSCALLKHKKISEYSTVWMDTLRNGETQLVNTNKLVRFYDGVTGLKTGTTNGAGSCLSASAHREGLALVAVVMGSPTSDDRFAGARKLLDYGFANYEMVQPPDSSAQLTPVPVLGGVEAQVMVRHGALSPIVIRRGQGEKLQQKISLVPNVAAPVEEGQTLGRVLITLDEMSVAEYDLKAACAVKKMTVGNAMGKLLSALVR